jgi:hypothetical protein
MMHIKYIFLVALHMFENPKEARRDLNWIVPAGWANFTAAYA